jgi:hypothetical protein
VIVQESKPLLGLKRSSSQSAAAILKAAASLSLAPAERWRKYRKAN